MLCVVAAICRITSYVRCMVSIITCMSAACRTMSSMRFFWNSVAWTWPALCRLSMNGMEVWSIGVPSGLVMPCTREIPRTLKIAFASRFSTMKSAGFQGHGPVSTMSTSGVIRDWEKWRSAAADPMLAGMSPGM